MQLLNAEFLQDLTDLANTSPYRFDIIIDFKKMYIRFFIPDDMFSVSALKTISKKSVEQDMKCFETLKEIMRLVNYYYDTNYLD